jgi:nucleoside-diphosphate-sugar epimerase
MKSRSISLTGATGFLGGHLAEAFVAQGWDVRAIVRRGSGKALPAGVSRIEADLTADDLSRACVGTDVVVHNAAVIRAPSQAAFDAVNVGGTGAAAAAARQSGARLLLISSQAAGGEGTPESPRHESDPPQPVNAYGRSKLAAEQILRTAENLRWTILRPCAVFGPRDRGFLPLFRMARRGLFFVPSHEETFFTLIHVNDLVRAVVLAVESERAVGETMFVGHPSPRTGTDLLRAIAAAEGRRFTPLRIPRALFSGAAALGDLAWKIGVKPLVDSGRLRELHAAGFVCSVDRIQQVLGFEAEIPIEEGIARTSRWYREQGWI